MKIRSRFVTAQDNLQWLVDDINAASWDEGNDICAYDVDALAAYLARQDTLFVECYDIAKQPGTLLGIASARIEMKPYAKELWLYVDEVDVCADQRQKGAGKNLMQALIEYAQDNGCDEVWLGTEVDNDAANALYTALDPDAVDQFVGYTFETD